MQTPNALSLTQTLVACLCADWCGTCREYRPRFEQLQTQFPSVRFLWIDVEDQSELVDPIEVENFPTLLLARGDHAVFFGTVTPHLQTLERLLISSMDPASAPLAPEPQRDGLVHRLQRSHPKLRDCG